MKSIVHVTNFVFFLPRIGNRYSREIQIGDQVPNPLSSAEAKYSERSL